MLECLVNGELTGHLPADDRGLHYGDGVFETLAVFRGQPRFWQLHMDRLANGCGVLGFDSPQQAVLLRELQTVCAGRAACVVKIIVTRGSSGRGYRPPVGVAPNRIVAAYPFPEDVAERNELGVDARICDLRLGFQPALAGLKHLNRLEQVLASVETAGGQAGEGILLDIEDCVVSAIAANLFVVSGDRLLTPRMDRCGVRGVMRAAILKAFKPRCEQRRITLDMLPEADEVFACNAVRGIVPIRRIGQWEYGVGQHTRELHSWLQEV